MYTNTCVSSMTISMLHKYVASSCSETTSWAHIGPMSASMGTSTEVAPAETVANCDGNRWRLFELRIALGWLGWWLGMVQNMVKLWLIVVNHGQQWLLVDNGFSWRKKNIHAHLPEPVPRIHCSSSAGVDSVQNVYGKVLTIVPLWANRHKLVTTKYPTVE